MTDMALPGSIEPAKPSTSRPDLDKGFNPLTVIMFLGLLAGGLLYVAYSLYADVEATGAKVTTYLPYLLLLVALLIALGFEFVNWFHYTANALMRGQDGTSGVDWGKATEIGYSLLLSPLFGFILAAVLLLVLKFVVRNKALYEAPKGNAAPPLWIRGILVLTCTLVSFFH